ncbi:MAG: transposase IS4 family protein [Ignavibacteria bacterium]|nr:MAG: transposase IS4 family protein [Ignavibacteria bacterium]
MSFENYDLDKVVDPKHPLRKIEKVISFKSLTYRIKDCASELGRNGYGLEVAIRCLFLQFYDDHSDREMERELRDSIALRWFCGFGITDKTPDHTYFCRMRKIIGTKRIGKLFKVINEKAKEKGMIGGVFSFVDATTIKTKEATWEERDKALAEGEDKLNNRNIEDYSADPDARFGCKGKSKFWFGYKRNICADMREGVIVRIAATPANVPDGEALRHTCPDGGMVFGDKAYGVKPAQIVMKTNNCHSGAILKNNMKQKNKDKDKWLTKVRMPFEGLFSKDETRARYRGTAKVQLQAFLEAMVHNVKRLVVVNCAPLFCEA